MNAKRLGIVIAVLLALGALALFGRGTSDVDEERASAASAAATSRTRMEGRAELDGGATASASPDVDGSIVAAVTLQGAPAVNARVRLYALHDEKWERVGEQQSDGRGEARFPARAGQFLLTAHVDGHAPAQAEVVRPWRVAETRVALEISGAAALDGRVYDARTAQPIAGAKVRVAPRAGDGVPPAEADELTTDAQGRFRAEGLAPGLFHVSATADGYGETTLDGLRVPGGAVELALDRGGGIDGVVVDGSGHAAPNAEVRIDGKEAKSATRADREGVFHAEVAPGKYQVSAKLGSLAGREESVNVGAAHRTAVRVVLEAAGALAGRITAKGTGAGVAGAKLELRETGTDFAYLTSTSDGAGHYQFDGLPPGDYTLRIDAEGFTRRERWHLIVLAGESYPCDVVLQARSALEGKVVDARSNGVANAAVQLEADDGQPRATVTDASGAFSFGDLPAGGLRVAARSGTGAQTSKRLWVAGGDTAHVELALGEFGTLTGHVKLASGRPLERGFRVYARPLMLEDKTERHVDVSDDGSYAMPLPPGEYAASAIGIGDTSLRAPAFNTVVNAGQTTTLDLTVADDLQHGLHGTVNEPDGTPSVEARVWAQLADNKARQRWLGQGTTDASGHFDLGVPIRGDGAQAIEVHARNGGRVAVLTGTFPDGADVTVTLKPPAHLFGELKDPDGKPVDHFTLMPRIHDGNAGPWLHLDFSGSHYDVPEIGAEPMTLHVWTGDNRTGTAEVTPPAGQATRVDITLLPSAKVMGKVVDEKGQPTDSEVRLLGTDGTLVAMARTQQPDFGFKFSGRAPGDYKLQVRKANYVWSNVPVTLTAGQTADVGAIVVKPASARPGQIGASFYDDASAVRIVDVLPGSPAAQAGLMGGEQLLAVNGARIVHADDAFKLVPGAPGTTVVLTIARGGATGDVSVTRAQ